MDNGRLIVKAVENRMSKADESRRTGECPRIVPELGPDGEPQSTTSRRKPMIVAD
jgi:hypothetical protein